MADERIPIFDLAYYYWLVGKYSTSLNYRADLDAPLDPAALRQAVQETVQRLPSFTRTLGTDGYSCYYEDNGGELPVTFGPWQPLFLGTAATNRYLFYVNADGNELRVCLSHGLADGRASLIFMRTLLFFYLRAAGLAGGTADQALGPVPPSWTKTLPDFAKQLVKPEAQPVYTYAAKEIFRIPEPEDLKLNRHFVLQLDTAATMKLTRQYEVTPVPLLLTVLNEAMRHCYDAGDQDIIALVSVDGRPFYGVKAIDNFAFSPAIPERASAQKYDVSLRATALRGRMDLLLQRENLDAMLRQMVEAESLYYQKEEPLLPFLEKTSARLAHDERQAFTYVLTYFGRTMLPACVAPHVRGLHIAMPTGILPLDMVVLDDRGRMEIQVAQTFASDRLIRAFAEKLRQYDIPVTMQDKGWLVASSLDLAQIFPEGAGQMGER